MTMLNPTRDTQTITVDGKLVKPMIDGVMLRRAITVPDERGSITEIFNPAWGFKDDPLVYIYQLTIRPGKIKGWVVHYSYDDRLFMSQGETKWVLYDAREDSATCGLISEIYLNEYDRCLMVIPRGVFHAVQNIGTKDAVLINTPTKAYDHANPDKHRLPLNTDKIPYKFENKLGW